MGTGKNPDEADQHRNLEPLSSSMRSIQFSRLVIAIVCVDPKIPNDDTLNELQDVFFGIPILCYKYPIYVHL